jgi:hypothetical protein
VILLLISWYLCIYELFAEALDFKKDVWLVFCDITAAFDRVWHKGLLQKLHNVGIQGELFTWFTDYLCDRYQRVVVQGQSSSWVKISAGVPQGSVLGPLLFLIYINDLPEILEANVRLFADDTSLFIIVEDIEESTLTLNGDLSALKLWADQWLISFNPQKTDSLYVSNKPDNLIPPLFFDNSMIENVDHHKHLGITISSNLTWNLHIEEVCTKALRRLDILRLIVGNLKKFNFMLPKL